MLPGSSLMQPRAPAAVPARLDVHMYDRPPAFDYRLSEVVRAAQERLRCLQDIEVFVENRRKDPDPDNFYRGVAEIVARYDFWRRRADDEASHWMLKFSLLNDEVDDTENFFRYMEKMVFAGRLFLRAREIEGGDGAEQVNAFAFRFLADFAGQSGDDGAVRVPFRFAGALLERYDVELREGSALVKAANAFRMVLDLFAEMLFQQHRQLREVARALRQRDPRLAEIAAALRREKRERVQYEETRVNTPARAVPMLARTHFPLCMEEIYNSLRRRHELRHWGRIQLALFLKGIGLSMENCAAVFLDELKQSPAASVSKKCSEYRYYVEHIYGRKGKKMEYTPWGCPKMASKSAPAAGDAFGCPFQYYSDEALRRAMAQKGVAGADLEDVLAARAVGYAQGCRQYYAKTHPRAQLRDAVGRHPNGYFASSLYAGRNAGEAMAVEEQSELF